MRKFEIYDNENNTFSFWDTTGGNKDGSTGEKSTTDFHKVIDRNSGQRLNDDLDVVIGSDCWIGRNVSIGKGVHIASNSVIGNNSVVTKCFTESNVLIAGNPATIKKTNIDWRY